MKKIVFVIESLHCGGAEKSLVTLLQNLDYKKYEVDLIITINNGDFQKFVPKEVNINVIKIFSNLGKIKSLELRILYLLRKYVNKKSHRAQLYWQTFGKNIISNDKKYDIAIAYNQGLATYFVATKLIAEVKYSWLNTDYKKAGYNPLLDYKFYNQYNKVICVSKENENSFLNEMKKIKSANISTTVIKDIVDGNVIKQLSLDNPEVEKKNKILILTVGRLAKAKGLHLAIAACAILKEKKYDILWQVIGEGPERKNLELLIKENNLQDSFELLGYKENPYPYINVCDFYVQTSLFEGLGLTVIEAGILKKPIVSTNFPTSYSIIENEETGLICDMEPLSIANSIERYINDIPFKEKIIKNLSLTTNNDKEITLNKVNELFNY